MALRVLSIGTEKALFEDGPIRRRILEQLNEVESATILVFAQNKFDQTIGNIRIVSTNSWSRWLYVLDGIIVSWQLRKEKINVVTTQDPVESALVGWFASKIFKAALAIQDHGYHFHGDYYARESFLNRLRSIFAKRVIKRADAIRVVSQRTQDALMSLGVNPEKILKFPVMLMDTHTIASDTAANIHDPYFLIVGRFVNIKRFDLAIKSCKIFSSSHPDYKLVIVGQGLLKQKIEDLIRESGLEDKIQVIPWTESLAGYYKNAVATLITSDREGFGMTALESLSNKTPVIMTDVGCANEVVINGKNGLVVPIGDSSKLSQSMETLVQNYGVYKQGAQEFVWNAPSFKMFDFLQTAIQNHKKLRLLFVTQVIDKNDSILGFATRWVQEFVGQGVEMTVFTRHMVSQDLPAGARGQDLGQSIVLRVLRLWYFSIKYRKQYDLVLVHMTPQLVVLGAPLWKLMGKRVYMWYMHRSITWWLKAALWLSDKTFTGSDLSLRLDHPKKTVVGHGIDTEQFKPSEVQREPVVLWVSRVHPRKHLDEALDFMAEFAKNYPDIAWKLKVIGSSEGEEGYLEQMKTKAGKLGIGERVVFSGALKHDDLPSEYVRAAAFISTSQTGSLDKVVLESLACGTPVLAAGEEYGMLPGVSSFTDKIKAMSRLADYLRQPQTNLEARNGIVQDHDLKRLIGVLRKNME